MTQCMLFRETNRTSATAKAVFRNGFLVRYGLFTEKPALLAAFLLLRAGDVDLLVRIGILTRPEHDRREGHGGGRKILHLLQREAEFAQHLAGQLLHVVLATQ